MGSRGESEKNERKQNHCGATASPRQENEIKDGIGELIQQERVVIFSKSTCPYCDDAKKVFDQLGQSYSTVELTDHPKQAEYQSALKEMTGAGTVPRVFVDGVCIGGGTDTVKLYEDGKLERILRQRSEDAMRGTDNPSERGSGEKWC